MTGTRRGISVFISSPIKPLPTGGWSMRSEEHTSELQSRLHLVCRLLLEKKNGTCVNVGCVPTKTLLASARAAHVARPGPEFGVQVPRNIEVHLPRVQSRNDFVVRRSNEC